MFMNLTDVLPVPAPTLMWSNQSNWKRKTKRRRPESKGAAEEGLPVRRMQ